MAEINPMRIKVLRMNKNSYSYCENAFKNSLRGGNPNENVNNNLLNF